MGQVQIASQTTNPSLQAHHLNKVDIRSTTKTRKLSQSSSSLAQLHILSKRIRLLSEEYKNNNTMASAEGDAPHLESSQLSRSSSTSSTSSKSKTKPSLTLDLSCLPPLSKPSPPSNTLIITELHNLLIFQPNSLTAIRDRITSVALLNSFSPLPSFRRIVCSFLSVEDAVKVRQNLESTKTIFDERGVRARIYFGEPTPIESTEEAKRKKLLEAPQSQKLFFISPPPSPPHGWVMRNEEPPNKEVHANDLAEALSRLGSTAGQGQSASNVSSNNPLSPVSAGSSSPVDGSSNNNRESIPGIAHIGSWPSSAGAGGGGGRSRSSTLIFNPNEHGGSPNLPAVMVEDTSVGEDGDVVEDELASLNSAGEPKKIYERTSRPPVELM